MEVNFTTVHKVYTILQSLCARVNRSDKSKFISFPSYPIDLATVQIDHLFVMGALESKSQLVRLEVFDVAEIQKGQENCTNVFVEKTKEWIAPFSLIRVCERKFQPLLKNYKLKLALKKEFCSPFNLTKDNPENIGSYLIHHLQRLLKNVDIVSLTKETFSLILAELEWREMYGSEPFLAFQNIISQITFDAWDSSLYSSVESNSNQTKGHKSIKKDMISIDEYFYASWTLREQPQSKQEYRYRVDIMCHLCQMFFDNILISKHILEHIEEDRKNWKNMSRTLIECTHCLRTFDAQYFKKHQALVCFDLYMYLYNHTLK